MLEGVGCPCLLRSQTVQHDAWPWMRTAGGLMVVVVLGCMVPQWIAISIESNGSVPVEMLWKVLYFHAVVAGLMGSIGAAGGTAPPP